MALRWNVSDVFLMIILGLWGSRRKTTDINWHSCCSISGYILSTWITAVSVVSDHLAQVGFVRFLHCRVNLFFFLYCIFWKEVTMCSSHLRSEELCSISHRFFSIIYICLDSWIFILYIGHIIQYDTTYFVAQTVSALAIGRSFRMVLVSFWHQPIILVF